MQLGETFALFYPGFEEAESDTFSVPTGGQVTITALGLLSGEDVTFEIVLVPAVQPSLTSCVPYAAELPSVAAAGPLHYCGERVKLTHGRNYVVIDAPQAVLLRAVANTQDNSSLWVWGTSTKTASPSEYMRGCGSQGIAP